MTLILYEDLDISMRRTASNAYRHTLYMCILYVKTHLNVFSQLSVLLFLHSSACWLTCRWW